MYAQIIDDTVGNTLVSASTLEKEVAKELGMEVKFQPISWASKEQELNSGNIDCIWNGFAYNEERAQIMTLTDSYIKGENYFILKSGSTVKSQEELKGLKIGVQSGSIQAQDLEKSEFGKTVEIIQYGENLTAFMDLETEGIDALFCSNIIGNYLITSKNKNYETIPSENITVSNGSVVAFKKGNVELKDKIQNALVKLNEEGKLDEVSNKWFGKDMIIIKEVD
jgi:polar amino acid transport system substrate-binding protein